MSQEEDKTAHQLFLEFRKKDIRTTRLVFVTINKNEKLKLGEFRCSECGGVFEEVWSEERALAEYRKMFGKLPKAILEEREPLCDGCYRKILMKISQ